VKRRRRQRWIIWKTKENKLSWQKQTTHTHTHTVSLWEKWGKPNNGNEGRRQRQCNICVDEEWGDGETMKGRDIKKQGSNM